MCPGGPPGPPIGPMPPIGPIPVSKAHEYVAQGTDGEQQYISQEVA